MAENFSFFHIVHNSLCVKVAEIYSFSHALFWQEFRETNGFTQ